MSPNTLSESGSATPPRGYMVFRLEMPDGSVRYAGSISIDDPNKNDRITEASNYFAEQAKRRGFKYAQSELVSSLSALGADPESIKSWNEIKQDIVKSEMPPLHKLLSELASEGVSAEVLEDLKLDMDFEANRKIFEQYQKIYFPDDEEIAKALEICIDAHAKADGKAVAEWKEKGFKGIPYSNHPIQLANIAIGRLGILDSKLIQALLLHDVAEDTDTKIDELKQDFDEEVTRITDDVTRREGESREDYMQRVRELENRKSKLAKCIDRYHNLLRSFSMNEENYHNPKKTFREYLGNYIQEIEDVYAESFETMEELKPIALKFFRLLDEAKKRYQAL